MSDFIDFANTISERWANGMWLIIWQGALFGVLVGLMALALRRARAATRGWLWMLVPIKLLIVPLLIVSLPVLPALSVADAPMIDAAPEAAPPVVLESTPPSQTPDILMASAASEATAPSVPPPPIQTESLWTHMRHMSLSTWLMLAWLGGVAFYIVRLGLGWRRMIRLASAAEPASDPNILAAAHEAAAMTGLARLPRILISEKEMSPCVFGVFRPTVLLPASLARTAGGGELSGILAHEFAHIRRYDPQCGLALSLCESLFFFHPVIHLARRQVMLERETACDEFVVAEKRMKRSAYARALVSAAEICCLPEKQLSPEVVAESFAHLRNRLQRLAARAGGMRVSRFLRLLGAAAIVVCIFTLPGVVFTAQSASTGDAHAASIPDGQVEVQRVNGLYRTFTVKPQGWVSFTHGLSWRYEGGKQLVFDQAGPRVYVSIDGAPPRLAGIILERTQDLDALRTELEESQEPLALWLRCAPPKELGSLPHLEKVTSLSVARGTQGAEGVLDLTPIASLTGLTSLQVRECADLYDIAPLAKLTELRTVVLWRCKNVADFSPLASLSKITMLDLHDCTGLDDVSFLNKLGSLTDLNLSGCEFVADISPLTTCTRLRRLDVRHCGRIHDLSALGKLADLAELELPPETSNDDLASVLPHLHRLTSLVLWSCDWVSDLSPLAGAKNLTSVELVGCVSVSDLSPLAGLPNLTRLKVNYCKKLPDLSSLKGMKKLTYLRLKLSHDISDLSPLGELTNLEELEIVYFKSLTDLSQLSRLTNLKRLTVWQCEKVSNLAPLRNLTKLQSLGLQACKRVSNLSPLANLKELSSLDLRNCGEVSDITPLRHLTKLTTLDLNGCTKIADISALRGLRNLRWLDLTQISMAAGYFSYRPSEPPPPPPPSHLSDLSPLAELKNLVSLKLAGCKQVSDLSALSNLRNLTFLDLSGCGKVENIQPLSSLSNLRTLYLANCTALSDLAPLHALANLVQLNIMRTSVADITPVVKLPKLIHLLVYECNKLTDVSSLREMIRRGVDVTMDDRLKTQLQESAP